MISYWLDVILCSLVVIAKVVQAIGIALLVQFIFYKVFKINLYKSFWKFLDRLDKRINEIFWERRVKDMFILRKDYDELNARVVELARQKRDLIKEKDVTVHNNTVLLEKNRELTKLVSAVIELSTSNDYDRPDVILSKIKELVRPLNQN